MAPAISVVVLTLNEGGMLRATVDALSATLPESAEIIVVDDGSKDGSTSFLTPEFSQSSRRRIDVFHTRKLGVAAGRNFGAAQARGELLVFSDAHVIPPEGWWRPLAEVLEDPAVGAVGPGICDYSDPEKRGFGMRLVDSSLESEWLCPEFDDVIPVPLLPGGFWATRREVMQRTGGLDGGMLRWGSEDFEFSLRLWMLGYELRVVPEIEVAHRFRKRSPYRVRQQWPRHNQLRSAFIHFSDERFARVKESLSGSAGFERACELFEKSCAQERRAQVRAERVRDDDWYFGRFGEI